MKEIIQPGPCHRPLCFMVPNYVKLISCEHHTVLLQSVIGGGGGLCTLVESGCIYPEGLGPLDGVVTESRGGTTVRLHLLYL